MMKLYYRRNNRTASALYYKILISSRAATILGGTGGSPVTASYSWRLVAATLPCGAGLYPAGRFPTGLFRLISPVRGARAACRAAPHRLGNEDSLSAANATYQGEGEFR
jgi:hypothetical protein